MKDAVLCGPITGISVDLGARIQRTTNMSPLASSVWLRIAYTKSVFPLRVFSQADVC